MLTEKQKKERRLGIGGSDVSVIMGLSSYKTRLQLYLEKRGEIEDDLKMNEQQRWGHLLEPVIREEFCRRNNLEVEAADSLTHPFLTFLKGNLDGFIPSENAVLEVKCSNPWMAEEWGSSESDNIPLPYILQVAHYCALKNADKAYIAVLIGGCDYRQYMYARDFELEDKIITACKDFWGLVQSGTPPEPVNPHDILLMFPQHQPGEEVEVNEEIQSRLEELRLVKEERRKLDEEEKAAKFYITRHMGTAEKLTGTDGKVLATWKKGAKTRTFLIKKPEEKKI